MRKRYEVGSWVRSTDGVFNWVNNRHISFRTKRNADRYVEASRHEGNLSLMVRDMEDPSQDIEAQRKINELVQDAYEKGFREGIETVSGNPVESVTTTHVSGEGFMTLEYSVIVPLSKKDARV